MEVPIERYQANFLENDSDEAIFAEIRRVATEHGVTKLPIREFVRLSGRVALWKLQTRFSDWQSTLEKAGCGHLYAGRPTTLKKRAAVARWMTDDEMLDELRRVHGIVGERNLTERAFDRHSITTTAAVLKRFRTWRAALDRAGVPLAKYATRNWRDDELFANLKTVWDHLGRQPAYRELADPPSKIRAPSYFARWGNWRKAVAAFVKWTENGAVAERPPRRKSPPKPPTKRPQPRAGKFRREPCPPRERRVLSGRLRHDVLERDGRRCAICGRGPDDGEGVVLHVDHILPVARGGKTTLDNLQTLCRDCNLGKGARTESPWRRWAQYCSPRTPTPDRFVSEMFVAMIARQTAVKLKALNEESTLAKCGPRKLRRWRRRMVRQRGRRRHQSVQSV